MLQQIHVGVSVYNMNVEQWKFKKRKQKFNAIYEQNTTGTYTINFHGISEALTNAHKWKV